MRTRSGKDLSISSSLSESVSESYDRAVKEFERFEDSRIPSELLFIVQEFLPGMCYNVVDSPSKVTDILLEGNAPRFSDLYRTLKSGRSTRGENSTHVLPIAVAFPTPFFCLDTTDGTRHFNLVQLGGMYLIRLY